MEYITLDKVIMALAGVIGSIFAFIVGRRKLRAETHGTEAEAEKTEFETFDLEMGRFLELLSRIEKAHRQSIEDDRTIAQLRRDVENCRNGHKDWVECRNEMVEFLRTAETTIDGIGDKPHLVDQLTTLRKRLLSLEMGPPAAG